MELHLTHALVLTQFESTFTPLDFDTIAQQDYAVHVVYNQVTKSLVFLSEPQKFDGYEQVIKFKQMLRNLSIPVNWERKIIIVSENECEYCAEDVKKYFNL